MALGRMGAEVVKVERIDGGDDARRMGPPSARGDAMPFHVFNRGKQSVALDLKSDAGRAAFEQLAAQADIFIHNLRPGVATDLGIDGPALTARHPRLIYCAISGYGQDGPYRRVAGHDLNYMGVIGALPLVCKRTRLQHD